ncbi:DUF2271 domain-containing protein [Neptuniibacter sp. QD72_48]|uniref:DUF2271 domain-containing protein n=1 Tax=Neptuniibacter sp. QD72_48 TaxID=3398214 RepID=UPI0039F46E2C
MKSTISSVLLSIGLMSHSAIAADTHQIELTIPQIATSKYQRPFVAVWVEQKGERKAVSTISVWFDDKKWLKDIRRWWRKAGRYGQAVDGVTGATRVPGGYTLKWDGTDNQGKALPAGEYTLYLEAVREHGDRTLLKQKVSLGKGQQVYKLDAGAELGPVSISIGESK